MTMTAYANDNACSPSGFTIGRALKGLLAARRHRRAIREMMGLNDHLLRDIGVNRFDVQRAFHGNEEGSAGARLARIVEHNRLERVRGEIAALEIRPNSRDEQVKLAA